MDLNGALEASPHEAVRGVLHEWYGASEESTMSLQLSLGGISRLASTWPIFRQNQLLDPPERDGSRRIFLVENQAVYLWSVEREDEDALVCGRFNEPDEKWQPAGERLATFALQAIVSETVMGTPMGASAVALTAGELQGSFAGLTELAVAPWHWPSHPTRFYFAPSLLAMSGPNAFPNQPDEYFSVFLAASDEQTLMAARGKLRGEWQLHGPAGAQPV